MQKMQVKSYKILLLLWNISDWISYMCFKRLNFQTNIKFWQTHTRDLFGLQAAFKVNLLNCLAPKTVCSSWKKFLTKIACSALRFSCFLNFFFCCKGINIYMLYNYINVYCIILFVVSPTLPSITHTIDYTT